MALLAERDGSDTRPQRAGGRLRVRWSSGWWPAGLVFAATGAVLHTYGVSVVTYLAFALYVGLAVTMPGMLLWRLIHRGSRGLGEDLAVGTAVGYGLEVLAYVPARAAGFPLASLTVPAGVIAAFVAIKKLRRSYWRCAERAPMAHSWTLAGTALVLLFWSTVYYRHHGFGWPSYGKPDIDLTFHLALVGELKHHMGLVTPWVVSEPIYYHWFAYADMAAASWATGIEPYVLVTRLSMLPVMFALVVAVAAVGRRVGGSWPAGALTALATFFALSPDPYGWVQDLFYRDYGFNATDDGSNLRLTLWTSPTQTFGALLFVPLMLILLDLLREHGGDRRRRIALLLLPAAVMGAKASFLPTLLCGLLLVVAAHFALHRRLHRVAAAALAVVLGWLVFAQLVLFGGKSQGLGLGPLDAMRRNPAGVTTHYTEDPRLYRLLVLLALTVLGWLAIWGGAFGLRRRLLEPDALLLLGLGLAGFATLVLFGHSGGQAEGFFLQGARPYLAALAVWGIVRVFERPSGLLAFGAGLATVFVLRLATGGDVPLIGPSRGAVAVTVALVWPWAVPAAVALGGLLIARRRPVFFGLVAVFLLGCTAPTAVRQVVYAAEDGRDNGWSERADLWPIVTQGTLEAGRWLRDHSSPNDLVATNMHCAYEGRRGHSPCDRRHFGIAAYSERRVLVESWAYTAAAHEQEAVQGVPQEHTAYWLPQVLADNDNAFSNPSAASIGVLRDRYRVRWLFTEDDIMPPSPELSRYATLMYRSGACAVYRI
ncbi:hypothetical protein Dvina_52585 [Dactylosporangium vinaceum]|uniref:Uncharacterized protein n=1 Tax=Dactylosporangium vinaceum TaxID=53362 RepID=A0ABV5MQF9_9ACTN|nr:hypothetical protein [Dactylosporangium vinaceum]UAB96462.1 hypothetical protein Dvina_52585 [Dactylosporangium vinaceum]